MPRPEARISKGQLWQKKKTISGEPFFALVIGKKDSKWKTLCSDGNTHSFLPFILTQKFHLVESK